MRKEQIVEAAACALFALTMICAGCDPTTVPNELEAVKKALIEAAPEEWRAFTMAEAALNATVPEEWTGNMQAHAYESALAAQEAALKAAQAESKRTRLALAKAAPEEWAAYLKAPAGHKVVPMETQGFDEQNALRIGSDDMPNWTFLPWPAFERVAADELEVAAADELEATAPDEYNAYIDAQIDEWGARERAQRTVTALEELVKAAPDEWTAYVEAKAKLKAAAPFEYRAYLKAKYVKAKAELKAAKKSDE